MRILILSQEVWRDDQNGGSVLTNLFRDFPRYAADRGGVEFAQVYCSEGMPQNRICRRYYQMTDKAALQNLKSRKSPVGHAFTLAEEPASDGGADQTGFRRMKKLRLESFLVAKEIVWQLAHWQSGDLRRFVSDFRPDLVFAPCYGWRYMQKLTRVIADWTGVPVISYISDDFYSCRQFRFSPVYWINHALLRRSVRKTFRRYRLVYTMTEEQKAQCEAAFGANMKVLRKSADFSAVPLKHTVNDPVRFVYGGNLYQNRDRTLARLADAIRSVNRDGVRMTLDVYSNTELSGKRLAPLNDGVQVRVHPAVPMAELREIYRKSDVALHAEGFDLRSRLTVRLSFSTKIIDCLASGCAVMAICHPSQSGYAYLKRNRLAICCEDLRELPRLLEQILQEPERLCEVQRRALEYGVAHLRETEITQDVFLVFCSML